MELGLGVAYITMVTFTRRNQTSKTELDGNDLKGLRKVMVVVMISGGSSIGKGGGKVDRGAKVSISYRAPTATERFQMPAAYL